MFINQKEIQNFNSKANISPNIIFNVIQSISIPTKTNTSIRINCLTKENDELLFSNNKEESKEIFISTFFMKYSL